MNYTCEAPARLHRLEPSTKHMTDTVWSSMWLRLAAMSTLLNSAFKSNFDYILACLEFNSLKFKIDFSFIQIHGMRE
jgi:hypothetical protein